MNNTDTAFLFSAARRAVELLGGKMRKTILKLGAVAIICVVIMLLISYFIPNTGTGTGIKPIENQLSEMDYEYSHMPVLGSYYVSAKNKFKEKFSFAKKEDTKIITSGSEIIKLVPVTFNRFEDAVTLVATDKSGNEMHIRLAGIIAPGNITTGDGSQLDVLALNYSSNLISSSDTIYLEVTEEKYDEFDRTLAYVWLTDNTFDIHKCVNAILSDEGYVKVSDSEFKYKNTFSQMEESAMESGRGLWHYPEF